MTKILLQTIRAEFEHTDQDIRQLCDKYSCSKKDLKGYTKWSKNILKPNTEADKKQFIETHISLVYEHICTDDLILDDNIVSDTKDNIVSEVITPEIVLETSEKIIKGEVIKAEDIPKPLRDGFEGLRKLDTALQAQAVLILNAVTTEISLCVDTRSLRDLAAINTSMRDSYFNTKSPMINIINGDVSNTTVNDMQELLESAPDDC